MGYDINWEDAANRHYEDGVILLKQKRFDNAGYHFGLAAECAVKYCLKMSGIHITNDLFEHFPGLKRVAMDRLGLQPGKSVYRIKLPAILGNQKFMEFWDIKMRYARNRSVKESLAIKMQSDADTAIGIMKS